MIYQEVLTLIETKLAPGTQITPVEHRDVEIALLNFSRDQWKIGDIKEIDCTQQYIIDNFESDGTGKNERVGWQICNGLNNTKNRTGRVSVAYGAAATGGVIPWTGVGPAMNAPVIGGNKNAVVVSHQHDMAKNRNPPSQPLGNVMASANQGGGGVGLKTWAAPGETAWLGYVQSTQSPITGVSGIDKNMQPYIVTLFIQKV
jgi:hypothetical protein